MASLTSTEGCSTEIGSKCTSSSLGLERVAPGLSSSLTSCQLLVRSKRKTPDTNTIRGFSMIIINRIPFCSFRVDSESEVKGIDEDQSGETAYVSS